MAIKDRITNIIDSIKASTEKKDAMKPIGPNINTFTWNESINPSGKIAVYTCLYGSYDKLHEPEYISDKIDYIVFTDEKIKKHSKWIKKDIPYKYIYDLDKKRLARYAKLLPHKVLPEYEYSIYVDANIIVKGDITKYIKSLTDYPVAMSWHPLRRCLYKEGLAFYIMKKITKRE
ncbi:MAG: DUF616 domain-containing protein, partial [Erysipelotrichaceae bacterium]|nr:DUF616 domain-containing protein [Erysipelotrichaceae bacterium]